MITVELIIDEIIETEKKISKHLNAFISQQAIIEELNFKLDESAIHKSLSECLKIVGAMQSTSPNQIQRLTQYQSDLTLIGRKLEHQIKNNNAQATLLKYINHLKTIQATSQDFLQNSQNGTFDLESLKTHLAAIASATVFYVAHYPKMQFTQDVMDNLSEKLPDDQDLESILNIPVSRKLFYTDFINELQKLDASYEMLNTECKRLFHIAKIITDLKKSEHTFIECITALTELKANFTGPFLQFVDLLESIIDTSRHFIENTHDLKLDPQSLKAHLTAITEARIFYTVNRPKMKFTKDEHERIINLLPKDLKLDSILMSAMNRNISYSNFLKQLQAYDPSYAPLLEDCKSILDDSNNALRVIDGDYELEKEKIASAKELLTSSQVIRHEKREVREEAKPSIEVSQPPPSNVLPLTVPTLANIVRTIQEICLLNFYVEGNMPADPNVYYSNSELPKFSQSSSSESSSSESTHSERSSSEPAMSDPTLSDFSDETDIDDFLIILTKVEESDAEDAPRLHIAETVIKPAKKLNWVQRTSELLWYYMGYETAQDTALSNEPNTKEEVFHSLSPAKKHI